MKVKHFFETHPVFRYEEFAVFMRAQGTIRPESWRQQLSYHQKSGNLIHLRKCLYAVKPTYNRDQWIDPYLIASRATPDAVLAYHTALELHGVAYTTFNELTYLTVNQSQSFSYDAQRFRAVMQPKALIENSTIEYGIEVLKREGMELKLTTIERSLVDVLDRPDLGGGWEEIWRSFDNITQLDIDEVVKYALLLKNATTIAKVGFFLEQRPMHYKANEKQLDKLLLHIPKQARYMNNDERGEGKYIEKWRLIVPLAIINRSWEEPNVENI